jgi:uncharacterized protein (TIGR00251 family)
MPTRSNAPRSQEPAALDLRDTPQGASLRVRVAPRSAHEVIAGVREGALLVRLTAPPVEGAANAALLRLLAKALGVPPSSIALARGARGRDKLVHIAGLRASEIACKLLRPS